MTNEKIRKLLADLQKEVRQTEMNAGARSSLRKLDSDIHELLSSSSSAPNVKSVVERAKLLEAEFAVRHPTVETVLREVIDTLARIGV
jgi:hypothetical protein